MQTGGPFSLARAIGNSRRVFRASQFDYQLVKSVAVACTMRRVSHVAVRSRAQAVTRATPLLTNCNAWGIRRRVKSELSTARHARHGRAGHQTLTRRENEVKRLTLTLIVGAVLAASLAGCIVVPAGGGYYHHGYYN
jgi:hypothetical protein